MGATEKGLLGTIYGLTYWGVSGQSLTVCTVFIRIVAGAIIYFEAYFPQNILSIFEKINISENLIILADQ